MRGRYPAGMIAQKSLIYSLALGFVLACDGPDEGAEMAPDVPLCVAQPQAPGCAVDAAPLDAASPHPACADGLDNDGDGRVDYPEDLGCLSPDDLEEAGEAPPPACADGVDNDEDGFKDFPADPGCASSADVDERDQRPDTRPCDDGLDNDRDGLVDLEDPGCPYADGPREQDPATPPQCSNGIDDDGDGIVDFPLELGCAAAGDDDETDPLFEVLCANGLDDDRDGRVDYPEDPGCLCVGDNDERDPPLAPACADGIDNDHDGRVDYPEDLGCLSAGGRDERVRCGGLPVVELSGLEARGDTRGARFAAEGVCGGAGASELIFYYRLEVEAEAMILRVEGEGGFKPALYARALCAAPLSELGCALPEGEGSAATLRLEAPRLGDYFIFVDGAASRGGAFRLSVEIEPLPACRNGRDDDDDGLTDHPFDPGCQAPDDPDEVEEGPLPACADGEDNDEDGRVDFPLDQGCAMAADEDELDLCGQGVRFNPMPPNGRVEGQIAAVESAARGSCGGLGQPEQIFEYINAFSAKLTFRLSPDQSSGLALYVRQRCADQASELGCAFGRGEQPQAEVVVARAGPGAYYAFVDQRLAGAPSAFSLQVIAERLKPQCADGVDNDDDGLIDAEDGGCVGPEDELEAGGGLDAACGDGEDNDGDGLTDYPYDPGCAAMGDEDEGDPAQPPACLNGLDDDDDGLTDYPADPGCSSAADEEEGQAGFVQCADGIDNDEDGLIDHPHDPGCAARGDLSEQDPARPPQCANRIDDDRSGEADYPEDPGCSSAGDPIEAAPAEAPACADGEDNDGDGRVDFPDEPGCLSAADEDEADPAFLPACGNGRDDDQNGRVDYPDDPGCRFAADPEERWEGRLPPRCEDGVDNDADGLTDLEDTGCARPSDDDETDPEIKPRCADGQDNDGDGRVDWPEDPGCEGAGDVCETWGFGLCGEVCEDLRSDPRHCGACDRRCAPDVECIDGFCGGLFTFEGILEGVEEAELGGWRACARLNYAEDYPIRQMLTDCDGAYIMYGCRPRGVTRFNLLAMGAREIVFQNTGDQGNRLNISNRVEWYFSQSYSIGFVALGTGVQRNSCDTGVTMPHLRMCWHTQAGQITSGYRCGEVILNGERDWERVIFTAD